MFAGLVFFAPNFLNHPDNFIPANPAVTPAHIVPEWYFLPFYAILRSVPNKLGGVILMFSAIAVLFVLPWLDTSPVRSTRFRPMYKPFLALFVVAFFVLGYVGGQAARKGLHRARPGCDGLLLPALPGRAAGAGQA